MNPFLPAGPHFIEVRKVGFVRWGKLASLVNGKSLSIRAKLKKARSSVRATDYEPLKAVALSGKEKFSDEYLTDFLFRMADLYGVKTLIVGYLDAGNKRESTLTLITFRDERVSRFVRKIPNSIDGYRPELKRYWKATFGTAIDPDEARPKRDRFSPTLFRVE